MEMSTEKEHKIDEDLIMENQTLQNHVYGMKYRISNLNGNI